MCSSDLTVKSIVTSLEMKIVNETAESLSLLVPPYRVDGTKLSLATEEIYKLHMERKAAERSARRARKAMKAAE